MIIHYLKILLFLLIPFITFSQSDNTELQKMYDEDQSSRKVKDIDWGRLMKEDVDRQNRVNELIKSREIVTSKDHYNAAMIFQHGSDTLASSMAVKHMKIAIELDSTINKWLLAAAIDRDLMRRQQPQIYGTQYTRSHEDARWKRYEIDTTKVTENERKAFNVPSLVEQLSMERKMNLKSISEFHSSSKSIKNSAKFIRSEYKKALLSDYDVSEVELNSFGYELLSSNKEQDALEIFILNTKLYPEGYNAFDSLGECLLLLGKKSKGIKAYKKSLALNPQNDNARKVINGEE